jgi:DNA-directed RNA polymerase specialized sigma subunit
MLGLGSLLDEMNEEEVSRKPEVVSRPKTGWGIFTEEMAWFIYDFFKLKLNGYEKLIFYSYYINGLSIQELAACRDISKQAICQEVIHINKKLQRTWKTRKDWRVSADGCSQSDQPNRRRNKKRSR